MWWINNQVPGLSLVWLVHVLLDDQGFRSWICNSEITSLENDGDGHTQCIVADQSHIQCYNKIWNSVTIILRTARCNFNHWIWIPWMVGSTVSSNMEIIKDPGYMWLKDSFEAGHLAGSVHPSDGRYWAHSVTLYPIKFANAWLDHKDIIVMWTSKRKFIIPNEMTWRCQWSNLG